MHPNKKLIIIIAACALVTSIFRDDPVAENMKQYSKLSEWVRRQDENAIFAAPFGSLTQVLPLFYRRGLEAGHAFPFNEDSMLEFCIRDQYLYGSASERAAYRGPWIGQSMANVYRSRKLENFIYFSDKYRLDFVILEHEYNKDLSNIRPLFSGDGFDIYSIKEMKAQGIKGYAPDNQDTICSKYKSQ